MTKQLKIVLEDLITFLLVLVFVSYIYPYGYQDRCFVPTFFNPLGVPPRCHVYTDPVSAPHHLFFIAIDALAIFCITYLIVRIKNWKKELKKSNEIVKNFIILYAILTGLSYLLAPGNCQSEDCYLVGYTYNSSFPHFIGLSLDSLAIVLISYVCWHFIINLINKRIDRTH